MIACPYSVCRDGSDCRACFATRFDNFVICSRLEERMQSTVRTKHGSSQVLVERGIDPRFQWNPEPPHRLFSNYSGNNALSDRAQHSFACPVLHFEIMRHMYFE